MSELKLIRKEAVPAALQKAERYRLINDPWSAESICLDVLEVDPENQQALIALLLSYTDEMIEQPGEGLRRAREVLPRLTDDYKRAYYAGIIAERRARRIYAATTWEEGRSRTTGFARRWSGTSVPSRSAPRRTTIRSCAGMPVFGYLPAAHMYRRRQPGRLSRAWSRRRSARRTEREACSRLPAPRHLVIISSCTRLPFTTP
jgi:hypothetical protein